MVELNDIKKIGIGTCRFKLGNSTNRKALELALLKGFNVIDTAPNYSFGESESLIGEVISFLQREKIFIISKAGYTHGISPSNLFSKFENIKTSFSSFGDHYYSIHPEFLNYQIHTSLKRLKTNYLDGFMLHNPEVIVKTEADYYQIKEAFQFLEQLVLKGVIRYYGISSFDISLLESQKAINLVKIVEIATSVSDQHHFKLIQIPFNLIENSALNIKLEDQNIFTYCKQHGITTFINRPLSGYLPDGRMLRLAKSDRPLGNENFLNTQFDLTIDKFKKTHSDFHNENLNYLLSLWTLVQDSDQVHSVFLNLKGIKQYELSSTLTLEIKKLKILFNKKSHFNRFNLTEKYFSLLSANSGTSIQNNDYADMAIEYCLQSGGDCILTGITKSNYVSQVKKFLN